MKLKPLQWFWMIGLAIFTGALMLDIVNVLNVPGRYLIVVPIVLLVISLLAGPSFKEVSKANRRG